MMEMKRVVNAEQAASVRQAGLENSLAGEEYVYGSNGLHGPAMRERVA
jgi:hypothetical protein